MRKPLVAIAVVAAIVASSVVSGSASQGTPQPASAPIPSNVPLQVQIVISRYQGEKRISSMPYTLSLRTGAGKASLRLGARVPIPSTVFAPVVDGKPSSPGPLTSFNYENVGINIDCEASAQGGGFDLSISVNESSAVTDVQELRNITGGSVPVFRSYQSTNALFLRDGQTAQFTAATDRVSGELVRVEVRLTVVK